MHLEETLQKERRDRASMEETLTSAYNETIRAMVEQQGENTAHGHGKSSSMVGVEARGARLMKGGFRK